MSDHSDNLVLRNLSEMREEFREMNAQVGGVGSRLERMEKSIDRFDSRANHAIHLAGVANAQAQLAEKKADLALERQKQFSDDLNWIKARIEKA